MINKEYKVITNNGNGKLIDIIPENSERGYIIGIVVLDTGEFRTFNINDLKLNSDKKSKGIVCHKI